MSTHRKLDLLVLIGLALLIGLYLYDAWRASTHIYNLILVMPLSLLLLVLCGAEFFHQVRGEPEPAEEVEPAAGALRVIALFSAYVISLNWLGFDLGTMAFVAAFLWLHGERRPHWVLGYALVFGFAVAAFFSYMLPYPMPMLILPSEF